jgi:hypothetical protein
MPGIPGQFDSVLYCRTLRGSCGPESRPSSEECTGANKVAQLRALKQDYHENFPVDIPRRCIRTHCGHPRLKCGSSSCMLGTGCRASGIAWSPASRSSCVGQKGRASSQRSTDYHFTRLNPRQIVRPQRHSGYLCSRAGVRAGDLKLIRRALAPQTIRRWSSQKWRKESAI